MRRFLFCLVAYILIVIQPLFGQSQVITEMGNALTEITGSFLDNPNHHSNTIKIYNLTSQCSSVLEEMYRQVPPSAESDFYRILNMKKIVKCLDFVTANIAGYTRGGDRCSRVGVHFSSYYDWLWMDLENNTFHIRRYFL